MKKNVASQVIGAQMCSATDGSAFTGTVTVYVTGDGGTQGLGGTASGVCTHEGNGCHTYVPTQAETNYDHIAFTFIGTGAIPVTVQLYTEFPQTGDSFARIGATGSGLTSVASAADLATLTGYVDTEVAAIKAKTDNLPSDPADASVIAAEFVTVNSTLSTIAGYIDTEVAAIKAKTDNLPAAPAATGDIPSATTIADAILSRNVSNVEASAAEHTLCTVVLAMLENSISGSTLTIKRTNGTTTHVTKTLTTNAAAEPITGIT